MTHKSQAERDEPVTAGLNEREMLTGYLDYHRATLLWKCEGLTDEQLKQRSVLPSNLTLLGLVRHISEVERSWFQKVFAGEPIEWNFFTDERPNDDFDALDSHPVEEVFDIYERACERSRAIVAAAGSLDDLSKGDRLSETGDRFSLRWILVHMLEEYARHNGHADLLREAIDGSTGD